MTEPIIIEYDGRAITRELFEAARAKETLIIIQFCVTKREVRKMDLSRLDDMIRSLSDIGAPAINSFFLSFNYDDDERELPAIPEVVKYIKHVIEIYPHIFYYLNPLLNQHIIMSCVPCTIIGNPLLSVRNFVKLDITAAETLFATIATSVTEYGATIGDYSGAKHITSLWHKAMNLDGHDIFKEN